MGLEIRRTGVPQCQRWGECQVMNEPAVALSSHEKQRNPRRIVGEQIPQETKTVFVGEMSPVMAGI